jgi:hypothetical protein
VNLAGAGIRSRQIRFGPIDPRCAPHARTQTVAVTRILLFDVPRMLSNVVRAAVAGEPDLELVGELSDPEQLAMAIVDREHELVILRCDGELPSVARALFDTRPRLRCSR